MSKIYEALQYAYKKKGQGAIPPFPITLESASPARYAVAEAATEDLEFKEEMLGLYKMIDSLLPDAKSKLIQFIGTGRGEGTSTITREFAKVAADEIGQSVLLLDADRHHPSQHLFFKIPGDFGWIEALKKGDRVQDALHRVEHSNLVVSPSINAAGSTPEIFNSPVFDNLLQTFKNDFELILIDSAPYFTSPDGLAIASKVDGIVLVVEAEKTKWQAVKMLKEKVDRVGGNILGVILNKRRFYIPQYIYKYL
ncbi:MAG: CpsD/CapB family tyrosine-protein kinase [Syntrophobacteraceae bacterium]